MILIAGRLKLWFLAAMKVPSFAGAGCALLNIGTVVAQAFFCCVLKLMALLMHATGLLRLRWKLMAGSAPSGRWPSYLRQRCSSRRACHLLTGGRNCSWHLKVLCLLQDKVKCVRQEVSSAVALPGDAGASTRTPLCAPRRMACIWLFYSRDLIKGWRPRCMQVSEAASERCARGQAG